MGLKHAMTSDSSKQELARTKSEIEEILRRVDSLPVLDPRPADEIFGYDEHCLPQSKGCDPR
jgi:hypothetical protein